MYFVASSGSISEKFGGGFGTTCGMFTANKKLDQIAAKERRRGKRKKKKNKASLCTGLLSAVSLIAVGSRLMCIRRFVLACLSSHRSVEPGYRKWKTGQQTS
jgi:hypothetical protein